MLHARHRATSRDHPKEPDRAPNIRREGFDSSTVVALNTLLRSKRTELTSVRRHDRAMALPPCCLKAAKGHVWA